MTAVKASIEIAAPPARVWDVIMDPDHFGDWVTIHRRLGHVDDGELREGFRVDQTLCLHHANFKVHWSLAEVDAPRRAVWEGKGPAGSHARIVDVLAPLDGGDRTRFDYLNEYTNPGGFLGRMAGRLFVAGSAEREAAKSLARLKAYVER
ncbi:MAG TPA: SRPBCC family protein [Solirubrobacteraceae bacterium]|nr:SRPBCC family protein [Solirubrobacteraceae bacterium]